MRLFTAIVPPADILDELDEVVRGVIADEGAGQSAVRWIPRSSWHLTLCFHGEDDLETRTAWLADRLRGRKAPELALEGSGTFPGVLWIGVTGELDDLAAAAGADAEERPYHPHLTLARWRRTGGRSGRALAAALAKHRSRAWRAEEVVLMRSQLSRAGARYTAQRRFPLS